MSLLDFFGFLIQPLPLSIAQAMGIVYKPEPPAGDPFNDEWWKTLNPNAVLGAGVGLAALGIGSVAAYSIVKAARTRYNISESWTDQAATPDYERAGRFRKYVKGWANRHKKGIKTIGALGLLGGALAVASQLEPAKPPAGQWGALTPGATHLYWPSA